MTTRNAVWLQCAGWNVFGMALVASAQSLRKSGRSSSNSRARESIAPRRNLDGTDRTVQLDIGIDCHPPVANCRPTLRSAQLVAPTAGSVIPGWGVSYSTGATELK